MAVIGCGRCWNLGTNDSRRAARVWWFRWASHVVELFGMLLEQIARQRRNRVTPSIIYTMTSIWPVHSTSSLRILAKSSMHDERVSPRNNVNLLTPRVTWSPANLGRRVGLLIGILKKSRIRWNCGGPDATAIDRPLRGRPARNWSDSRPSCGRISQLFLVYMLS